MKRRRYIEVAYIGCSLLFLMLCIFINRNGSLAEGHGGSIPVIQEGETNVTITPTPRPTRTSSPIPSPGEMLVPSPPVPTDIASHEGGLTPTVLAEPSPTATPEPTKAPEKTERPQIVDEAYEAYSNELQEWWFRRKNDHSQSGSGEEFPIRDYDAFYLDTSVTDEDKVVYLTFDCGYENGFTPAILDTLKKHDVKAMFFVTKSFITGNPEYVIRMKEEGHLVGNHTVRHLSSPSLKPSELAAEIYEVEETMRALTGYELDPFFRPPSGKYSERTLKVTQDLSYASIFWSIAYYDYDRANQPGKDYVVDHFKTYHHNGTIILMHNISQSNCEALEDVVLLLKEEGYRFAPLTELMDDVSSPN